MFADYLPEGVVLRFQYGELSVAYEREGTGSAVLFLHNGGTSRRIWRPQMQALAASHDVVAVDLPGFGDSPLGPEPLTLAGYVDVIGGLVDGLGLAPVVIVGNCMGSNIATGVAEARPDDVRGLVLVNPLTEATFSSGWLGPLHTVTHLSPRLGRVIRSVSRRLPVPRPLVSTVLRFQLGSVGVGRGIHHDPELIACNTRAEQMPALIDVLADMPAYGQLDSGRELPDVPVVTIWGDKNRVLSPRRGKALNRSLHPDSELVLDGCGHLPMLEMPDAVTRAIEEVLEMAGAQR